MSHAVYQTPALILKTKNMRESNKLVYLYTKKFGLIYASMQSLRDLRSKMRYHIHPHALVDVDVVQGRNIWRITGVHEHQSAFQKLDTPWYRLQSLVCDMVHRLCIDEDTNESLWNDIHMLYDYMYHHDALYHDVYEYIIMVRILYHLGYWSTHDTVVEVDNPYVPHIVEHVAQHKAEYIKKINEALHDSQL